MASETGWSNERFEFSCELCAIRVVNRRREADVIQKFVFIVEPEKQRAHNTLFDGIPEAPHHAICRAELFDFLYSARALAGLVASILSLGNNPVETCAHLQPAVRLGDLLCGRRKPNSSILGSVTPNKVLEFVAPLLQWSFHQRLSVLVNQVVKQDQ